MSTPRPIDQGWRDDSSKTSGDKTTLALRGYLGENYFLSAAYTQRAMPPKGYSADGTSRSEPTDRDFLLGVTQDPRHDGKPVMESISLTSSHKTSYLGGQRSCQM